MAASTRARAGDARTRARGRGDLADEYSAAQEASETSQPAGGPPPDPASADPPPPARTPSAGPRARGGRRANGGRLARGERWFDSSAREAGRLTLAPPKRLTARDGSGFLFGLLVYVLGLNFVRHGPEGVKGWLGAKFLNKPWTQPDDPAADKATKRDGAGGPGDVGQGGTARAQPATNGGLGSTRPRPPKQVTV